ncbi:ABC transporter substrate-binding protein [Kibdelosporangium lantanae]
MRPLLLAILLLTACSAPTTPAPPPGVLTVGLPEPTLPGDPTVTSLLWTPVVDYDPTTGKVTPRAAAAVTSTDQVTWTITLNPATYTDGRPVTAQSYVDAWRQQKALPAKEVTATGERTIQVVLARPDSDLPAFLASPLALPYRPEDSTLGDGPFRLTTPWQPGEGAHAVRVHYEPGKAKEIDLRVFTDMATAYDQVKAGTLDMALAVPGARHDAMHTEFADRHVMWAEPTVSYLVLDQLTDPAARFAVSMAVDRKALAAGAMDNQVDPATALLPPAIAPGERSGACRACANDPAAAKSLRDQAGLTAVTLRSKTLADPVHTALGVDVTSGPVVQVRSQTLATLSPYDFLASLNVPAIQQYLDSAAASGDFAERAQLYRLAENQVLRDLPVAPLWSAHGHAVWGPRIQGVTATSAHGVELAGVNM